MLGHAVKPTREFRIFLPIRVKQRAPVIMQRFAAPADTVIEMLAHAVWHQEFGVFRPAIISLGETDFFLSERLAVRRAGVLFMRRAKADMTVDDDEGRDVVAAGQFNRLREALAIVGVAHLPYIPAIGQKARGHIVAESQIGVAFDGDAIAVVDPAQVAEHLVPGERGGFVRHALHHVAVAAHCVHAIIKNLKSGAVEMLRQPAPSQGHADAVATTLAKRAGRGLDARRHAVLGMTRTFAVELSKFFDVVETYRRFAIG